MQAQIFSNLLIGAIPIFVGVYATLLGFGVVTRTPGENSEYNALQNRLIGFLKVFGPVMMLLGVFLEISGVVRAFNPSEPVHETNRVRYATSDGVCSAEFPGTPKHDIKSAFGIASDRLTLLQPEPDLYYMLTFSDLPTLRMPATDEERFDAVRDGLPAMLSQSGQKAEFVSEIPLIIDGIRGREMEFVLGTKSIFRARMFLIGARIYRINTVTPRSMNGNIETKRFRESFHFEKTKAASTKRKA